MTTGKTLTGVVGLPPARPPKWKGLYMTYEDFTALTEEEQKALFATMDDKAVLFDDMEAERDSFKHENEKIKLELSELKTEMKKTKELNFTLARSVKTEKPQSAEDILHDMFTKK